MENEAVPANTGTFYFMTNSQGWVEAITDSAGIALERYSYDAYGQVIFQEADGDIKAIQQSDFSNPYLYGGYRYDAETGFYYCNARYYNPKQGRFVSRDPVNMLDGANLYNYCRNNPINFYDPLGLASVEWHHLLPIAVFDDVAMASIEAGIDIHSAEYAKIMLMDAHRGADGGKLLHDAWSAEWAKWFKETKERLNKGQKISKTAIDKQLKAMLAKNNYKSWFKGSISGLTLQKKYGKLYGQITHGKWLNKVKPGIIKKIEKQLMNRLGKKAAKGGGKAVPIINIAVGAFFFWSTLEEEGLAAATADLIPVLSTGRAVYQVGDALLADPEYELYRELAEMEGISLEPNSAMSPRPGPKQGLNKGYTTMGPVIEYENFAEAAAHAPAGVGVKIKGVPGIKWN